MNIIQPGQEVLKDMEERMLLHEMSYRYNQELRRRERNGAIAWLLVAVCFGILTAVWLMQADRVNSVIYLRERHNPYDNVP